MTTFKKLKTIWIGLLTVTVLNCGHVTIYDKEVCGDLGSFGAHCAHTLTDKKRDMTKAVWDHERVGWLCTNATGFNDTETSIDQFCATSGLCDYELKEEINASMSRMRGVAKKALAARKKAGINIPFESEIQGD